MLKKEIIEFLKDFDDDVEVLVGGTSNYTIIEIPGEKSINIIQLSEY
jgi:hypothetical protein